MIVITLTKVPAALRGDLTKWYQEIQTGVYVGNVSARIRDQLWERILKTIGQGEATMVYNAQNELGYQFKTTRQDRQVVDFDGIPLMMHLTVAPGVPRHGFSKAAKFHRARVMTLQTNQPRLHKETAVVAVDVETTGLNPLQDVIIAIGAVKSGANGDGDTLYRLIQIERPVPPAITKLTGLTTEMLMEQGVPLSKALADLRQFVGSALIVGYNYQFDASFLASGFRRLEQADLTNTIRDLLPIVKTANQFLDNYRLPTVLAAYDISNETPHQALADARATLTLAHKLMKTGDLSI
ncbi:type I-E CRISPR-associated endoribonuclease Cas2e [Levilactobacillus spicheri]